MRTIFGREPAFWVSAFQVGLVLAVSFGLDLTTNQTGAIVAVLAAAAGLATALATRPIAPAVLTGAAQAVIALVVAFGLEFTAEQTGAIMTAVAFVGALVAVRPQVSPVRVMAGQRAAA